MSYTAEGLVEYCKKALKMSTLYMYGALMRPITTAYVDDRAKAYPSHYSAARIKFLKSKVGSAYGCDCVGLIKSYYWGGVGSPKYRPSNDVSANGMYQTAKTKGPISTIPELPGVCVQMDGHIGVYIGNGKVIECTSNTKFGDGVCETNLKDRKWEHWLYCPFIQYELVPAVQGKYTVQAGDSLWAIAEKYLGSGARWEEIKTLNGLHNSLIVPGQLLKIPLE